MINYKQVFTKLENGLMASMGLSRKEFDKKFVETKELTFSEKSDDWYFDTLKFIAFYSGFKADTVTKKTDIINKYFPDYQTVAKYGKNEIKKMMDDKEMISHLGKIEGTIKNANIFIEIIKEFGSIHNYLVSLNPEKDLKKFYNTIKKKFAYLGEITAFHFMLEIGLDVVKPDRVLARIFERLGLIENEKQYWELINYARAFARETGHPIRYIDMIFVMYGQVTDFGICLDTPKCEICQLTANCEYFKKKELKK